MERFVDYVGVDEKKKLDASFARAMFASGLPLSTFSNPYWTAFFSSLRPSYQIPSRYFLGGSLLDEEFKSCTAANKLQVDNAPALGIMTDSFTNVRQESVIDIVLTTPRPVLYKQIYRGVTRETGEYLGTELKMAITEVGPDKVWILVTDNASNMRVAWEIVTREFPHITAVGCSAHC
ncbi:UDP-N-acetylglucosamine--N-acetylmuramyl-(pentapeptide) pyrophosphoryl-undecaprenol N-acetylglucosamine transferase [Frankliniella fusca]|uniref:UDP-N-acetylglucosamine--N-acetylmuramyl-(Pentapeptide) pyrophosphoryl-undecaprenol N-acetylglucosamine transferase n=1 Tax=Frankliniella fusca TaxID=407009 RepID=A0AAE1GX78_9NEOP|nr:UDP-N-acetylglucosamine--N-acetylmuramyl-(pentapeptide) pyrophosphoryl-undecaprenol N-acetylglucosamine transferase [Frankliniella fusca]KAK3910545.1 UDP-N-acetylglucosamine--N-acetylmuramyl-(pentapeptide) pyrophosphoryl-undecaprenol N-acetylglucosamine transferase [Frankliniella fusca]